MASLAVADNEATPTGAVATIAGSSGGSNQVYVQNVDGELGSGAWTLAGSRTGDGTVALALDRGYYWAYCLTGGTAVSGLAYFRASDGLDAVIDRCFDAVKARVQLLALPCTARVYDSQYALTPLVQYPCTVLTREAARRTQEHMLNGRDDLGHPVRLLVKDVCLKFDDQKRRTYQQWAQAILRCFIGQRLTAVPESVLNKVELGEVVVVESNSPQAVLEVTVRCVTREVRGLGA